MLEAGLDVYGVSHLRLLQQRAVRDGLYFKDYCLYVQTNSFTLRTSIHCSLPLIIPAQLDLQAFYSKYGFGLN